MARIVWRLFAGPREAAGAREVVVDVPVGATVEQAVDALVERAPALAAWRATVVVSVNREVAAPGARVREGDELAFMPPVSGGGEARVVDGRLSLDGAAATLARDGAGAVVAFLGIVRSEPTAIAERVERLEFEAYPAMADRELVDLRARAIAKFDLVDALLWHRVGVLATGEDIVLVAVSARHRHEAFEAASFLMDELKRAVPIWKKEVGTTQTAWVNDPVTGGDRA